ncbi:MAG: FlgD immunoglobulin-like domain containing protein [bacterium]
MEVNPNPTRGRGNFRFHLARETIASLRVHNAAGRFVAEPVCGRLAAGAHEFAWPAGELPAGVYYFTLNAEGRSETRSVTVTR